MQIPLQNHSKYVADALANHLTEFLEPEFIAILQSFIYPKYMICNPEAPSQLDENAPVTEMKVDSQGQYQFVPVLMKGEAKDPIHELFVPPSDFKEGKC